MQQIKYLVIDLFCGAGGTTLGFESAMSKDPRFKLAKVIACVNHDHLAIKSHWANHPEVEHFEEDIRHLDPYGRLRRLVEIYRAFYPEAKVILWASLECTNFSKAKGGLPRDADSRTLAEHLYKYILALDPDFIQIENVVEFMSWGPLVPKIIKTEEGYECCQIEVIEQYHDVERDGVLVNELSGKFKVFWRGFPESKKKGQDWLRWRRAICEFGYHDDWKELNAADFGALTSRNRLFGCFARKGVPIAWPEPTHAKRPEKSMYKKSPKKWRAVKEALDFSDEGNSVFNRKKPLSPKTMQRLFMGCVKHIAGGKTSFMAKAYRGDPKHQSKSLDEPAGTLTTIPNQQNLVFITKWNSNDKKNGGHAGHSVEEPSPVVSTQNRLGAAFIVKGFSANSGKSVNAGSSVDQPAPTITTQSRERLAQVDFISRYNGVNGGKHDNSHSVEGPVGALGCGDNHAKVTAHFLANYYSEGGQHSSIDLPSPTVPTRDRIAKVQATFIDQQFSQGKQHQSVDEPLGAITTVPKSKLVQAEHFIANGNSHNTHTHSLEDPAPTLTAGRHHHYIVNPTWFNEDGARSIEEPCFVVIARQDKAPLYLITCKEGPVAVPVYEGDCEWTVKLKEFMVLYDICDIKMRMLKVVELKVIQGFPADYVLLGNQTEQKKFIGNAVEKSVPKSIIEAMEDREMRMAA